jgi:hypothetical protein
VSELTPAAQCWLADHHGVITTRELRRSGVGKATIARLVDSGVLRPVHKGVFVVTSSRATVEQRCAALCAAHPTGFVTGPTAGVLAGLRRMPPASAVHFSVRHGIHVTGSLGVRYRQTTALSAFDRTTRPDGIVVASSARLAFDLAADLRQLDHLSVLNQLLHERRVTTDELSAIGRRLCHPARPGSQRFAENVARLGGSPANESHPEVVLSDALLRRNVPVEHQTRVVRLPDGRTVRIDLAVPDVRWGVELDIHPEHGTFEGRAAGARRARQLRLVGWQIEHVTEPDMQDVEALADELAAIYHARRREVLAQRSIS